MPDAKITDLAVLTAPDVADLLALVDVSDVSMAASGTTKKTTFAQLRAALAIPVDVDLVHDTGNETIAGTKTFSTAPVLGSLTGLLKGASGTLSPAAAGTDYLAPTGNGSGLTALNATALTTGTVATARLGTGSATSSTFLRGDGTWDTPAGGGGGGDASTNTSSSVDSELALFSGTAGKTLKRATATGLLKAASGVLSAASAGTDYLAPAAIGTTVQAYDADLATIAGLADPNADRILFWDDSAGAYAFLTAGTGLTITGTTIDAAGGGGGGGITVGAAVTSGTNDRVFYQSGGNVAQHAGLTYDGSRLTSLSYKIAGNGFGEELTFEYNSNAKWLISSNYAGKWFEFSNGAVFRASTTSEAPVTARGMAAQAAALLKMEQKSSTSVDRSAAYLDATLATATDASWKGRFTASAGDFSSSHAGRREGLRVESDGTQAMLGFFGGSAVVKPTVTGSRGANAALQSLLTALANLGLITDSSS